MHILGRNRKILSLAIVFATALAACSSEVRFGSTPSPNWYGFDYVSSPVLDKKVIDVIVTRSVCNAWDANPHVGDRLVTVNGIPTKSVSVETYNRAWQILDEARLPLHIEVERIVDSMIMHLQFVIHPQKKGSFRCGKLVTRLS